MCPGLLETDLQRTDIDCSERGRAAAAYAHQGIRNRRGRSTVVHVVGDQFALEPFVRAEFPGPPQQRRRSSRSSWPGPLKPKVLADFLEAVRKRREIELTVNAAQEVD